MKSRLGVFACNLVTLTKAIADILKLKLWKIGATQAAFFVCLKCLKKGLQSFLGGDNCFTFKV